MKNRIPEIDLLRALAIIFIVFSHIGNFTHLAIFYKIEGVFAFFGLSIFFFISGFLLRLDNNFSNVKDVYSFLKKRVINLYPLYWLSIFTIYVMNILDFDVVYSNDIAANKLLLFLNILGLQGFVSENYNLSIWWFVGVIMLYYFLFSIILYYSKSNKDFLIFCFLTSIPFIFLRNEFNIVHTNVLNYYFIFIAGILSATVQDFRSFRKIAFSFSIFLLALSLISYIGVDTGALADFSKRDFIFLLFALIFTIYKIKISFNSRFKSSSVIVKLADSSFSVYLFHIPFLTVIKVLFDLLVPFEAQTNYLYYYFELFANITLTFLFGYIVILFWNKIKKKLAPKISFFAQ